MQFLEKLNAHIITFDKDVCSRFDQASLYGEFAQKPPLAKHIVFDPAPQEAINSLVENYKLSFPTQLLELYNSINGACLFWSFRSIGKKQIRIPFNSFSIFGIPLSHDRKHLEPFNISIEDLNRPNGTPDCWLKFGSFLFPNDYNNMYDLFVDVDGGDVYAVKHNASDLEVVKTWKTIDDCLCNVFDICVADE